jgi:arsenate reductase
MAEAYLNHLAAGELGAESAGLEPGSLNPNVIEVLKEDGIDISANTTTSVFDLYKKGNHYDFVIVVCSEKAGARCPIFPGRVLRLHWPFDDPSAFTGTHDDILKQTRTVRDAIKEKIIAFIDEYQEKGLKMFIEREQK